MTHWSFTLSAISFTLACSRVLATFWSGCASKNSAQTCRQHIGQCGQQLMIHRVDSHPVTCRACKVARLRCLPAEDGETSNAVWPVHRHNECMFRQQSSAVGVAVLHGKVHMSGLAIERAGIHRLCSLDSQCCHGKAYCLPTDAG